MKRVIIGTFYCVFGCFDDSAVIALSILLLSDMTYSDIEFDLMPSMQNNLSYSSHFKTFVIFSFLIISKIFLHNFSVPIGKVPDRGGRANEIRPKQFESAKSGGFNRGK